MFVFEGETMKENTERKLFTTAQENLTCRAIALANNMAYSDVEVLINDYIKMENLDELYIHNSIANVSKDICYKILKKLNWKWVPIKGCYLKDKKLPNGELVVSLSQNTIIYLRDNVAYDTNEKLDNLGNNYIYGYWIKT